MEHPSHDESDRTSPRRGTSLVAPIRAPSDLPGDRNCLSDRYETDEQGFSGPRRYLSVDRALHKSGSDSVVQHYFRFSRRGAKRTPRNRELHDGYLPEVQWRGILDEHFHALSGVSNFPSGGAVGNRSTNFPRGLGGLFPALHSPPMAQRYGSPASANHARLLADCL